MAIRVDQFGNLVDEATGLPVGTGVEGPSLGAGVPAVPETQVAEQPYLEGQTAPAPTVGFLDVQEAPAPSTPGLDALSSPSVTPSSPQGGSLPPSQGVAPAPLGGSGSSSSSGSSGINFASAGKMQKESPILSGLQAAQAQTEADARAQAGRADADAREALNVAKTGIAYEQSVADVQFAARQELMNTQARLAAEDDLAREQAGNESKAARARYEQSLAAVRNMEINPAAIFGSMSSGEKVGVGAALFAQGFLAAQGITINAQGALDTWINRSIEAQRDMIERGLKLADGDKMMWDMARAEASDEADARTRVSGYLIERAKGQIEMAGSRFTGDYAKFKTQEALSTANQALSKVKAQIETNKRDFTYQNLSLAQKEMESVRQNAQASANRAEGRRQFNATLKAKATDVVDGVIDPETNEYAGYFRAGTSEPLREKTKIAAAYARRMQTAINKLRAAQKDVKLRPGRLFASEEDKKLRQAWATVFSMANASDTGGGKTLTQLEKDLQTDKMPMGQLLSRGDIMPLIDNFADTELDNAYSLMQQTLHGGRDASGKETAWDETRFMGGQRGANKAGAADEEALLTDAQSRATSLTKYQTDDTERVGGDYWQTYAGKTKNANGVLGGGSARASSGVGYTLKTTKDPKSNLAAYMAPSWEITMEETINAAKAGSRADRDTLVRMAKDPEYAGGPVRAGMAEWALDNVIGYDFRGGPRSEEPISDGLE